ncbi:MAG: hypothetical protein JNK05_25145 [Myxococcales bacterium]|nr:hypothetical protein [Myxococcales bacterium]
MRRAIVLGLFAVGCTNPAPPPMDATNGADSSITDGGASDARDTDAAVDVRDGRAAPIVTCDDAGVCSGTADPVSLGAGIEPVVAARSPRGPLGSHWFCRPRDPARWNGRLVVHVVGTWSDPANDHRFPEQACALGFVAIAPMYENRDPARETCLEDGPCYEAHRREIVDGVEGAPAPVDVDRPNSLRNRIATLLARLAEADGAPWPTVRDRIAGGDWRTTVVSGHSQGSGHALYLAREEVTERLVLLAGPSDRLGDRTPTSAPVPWIAALRTTPPRTPAARIFGYMHDDDSIQVVAQVLDNWDAIGLAASSCAYARAAGYPNDCRRVRIAGDMCDGLLAHSTVVVRRWGASCMLGTGDNTNEATWRFLLTAGE